MKRFLFHNFRSLRPNPTVFGILHLYHEGNLLTSQNRVRIDPLTPKRRSQSAQLGTNGRPIAFSIVSVGSFLVMDARLEQRSVLKFLCKSGQTPINCWRQLHDVFGLRTMSKGRVWVWHRQFSAGDERIKDKPKSGRPKSARSQDKIQQVQQFLNQNRAVDLQDIASEVGISVTSAHRIVKKDLKLSKLCPKFVPKDLTQAQKDVRVQMCQANLDLLKEDEELLTKIVTGDESWVSVFELPSKKKSSEWLPKGTHRDRPQKALPQRSDRKSMLTVFFDAKGVVLSEFAPRGVNICSESYCATIKVLKERLRKKRPTLWKKVNPDEPRPFWLHHDNASSHTAAPTIKLLQECDFKILQHPPNSPDLAPCDYFLFPRMKNALRGVRHPNVQAMQAAV